MEGYVNMLPNRGKIGDLMWSLQSWEPDPVCTGATINPQTVIKNTRESADVKHAIREVCRVTGQNKDEVEKQADNIIAEMAHNQKLSSVRLFGFVLSILMKRLYSKVFVNRSGIENVRSVINKGPILLLPSHRSYVDFLLLSYLCFHYHLPLPVTAAGMDFKSMKIIGTLMRNAGAFFIQRTFGGDRLYWTIFKHYLQEHISNNISPLEFFLEGTRSRTGKTLPPKIGVLSSCLQSYFFRQCPDIFIVPVSFSYDRTLEESLYSYELLGVPKPKESTSGFLKAQSALQECYGNIYVHFGTPISVHKLVTSIIRPSSPLKFSHSLLPSYLETLNKTELAICTQISKHIVVKIQTNMIVPPFAIVAFLLQYCYPNRYICVDELVENVEYIANLIKLFGGNVPRQNWKESVEMALKVHVNILEIKDDKVRFVINNQAGNVKDDLEMGKLPNAVMQDAAPVLMMQHYSVQCFNHLVLPAIVLTAAAQPGVSAKQLYEATHFIESLLQFEFVHEYSSSCIDVNANLWQLEQLGILNIKNDQIELNKSDRVHEILISALAPYLQSYSVLFNVLIKQDLSTIPIKDLKTQYQKAVLNKPGPIKFVMLSLDLVNNAVLYLCKSNVLKKTQEGDLLVNMSALVSLSSQLQKYAPKIVSCSSDVVLQSKL